MIIKPLLNYVLVEPIVVKRKSIIELPDSEKKSFEQGMVVAIGYECKYLKVGNRVLFNKYSANETSIDDKSYLMLEEKDIFAVIENEQ